MRIDRNFFPKLIALIAATNTLLYLVELALQSDYTPEMNYATMYVIILIVFSVNAATSFIFFFQHKAAVYAAMLKTARAYYSKSTSKIFYPIMFICCIIMFIAPLYIFNFVFGLFWSKGDLEGLIAANGALDFSLLGPVAFFCDWIGLQRGTKFYRSDLAK